MLLFQKYYQLVKKYSNWRSWLFSFVIVILSYYVVNSSFIGAEYVRQISGGTAILDTYFYFPPHVAYDVLTALGTSVRAAYFWVNIMEIIFPITYGIFLTISFTMTYTFIYPPESKRNWLILMPLLAMAADFAENICIFLMIINFPTPLIGLATAASLLIPLKYTLIVVAALLIFQGNMKVTSKLFGKK